MQVTLGFSLKIEEISKWRCYICNFSLRISKKKKKKWLNSTFLAQPPCMEIRTLKMSKVLLDYNVLNYCVLRSSSYQSLFWRPSPLSDWKVCPCLFVSWCQPRSSGCLLPYAQPPLCIGDAVPNSSTECSSNLTGRLKNIPCFQFFRQALILKFLGK